MPQAEAFCEEHGRNITLDEAHKLYFAQPEGKRRRFTFRCGDPRCRAMLQPKVVGALYDRKTSDGEENLRSPYYREIAKYEHIINCTWKNEQKKVAGEPGLPLGQKPSNPIEEDLGLIFKLKPRAGGGDKPLEQDDEDDDRDDDDVDGGTPSDAPSELRKRAETSKFMATVAMRYLQYTEHQRQTVNLTLEGIRTAPFYNICMPIKAFHPHYQPQQIYQGRVRIDALTNVFFIRFLGTMSPTGDKSKRTTVAQIKLLKSWLEKNDRALGAVLSEIASAKSTAWCFFYTPDPIEMNRERAQFTIQHASHIAVIDEAEIKLMSQVEP